MLSYKNVANLKEVYFFTEFYRKDQGKSNHPLPSIDFKAYVTGTEPRELKCEHHAINENRGSKEMVIRLH